MKPLLDGLPHGEREALEQRIPALRTLRIQYISVCDACAQAALSGDGFEEMERRRQSFIEDMVARQREILRQNGIDSQSLQGGLCLPRLPRYRHRFGKRDQASLFVPRAAGAEKAGRKVPILSAFFRFSRLHLRG